MLARCGSVCPFLGGTWEAKAVGSLWVQGQPSSSIFQANEDLIQFKITINRGQGFMYQEKWKQKIGGQTLAKPFFPAFSQKSWQFLQQIHSVQIFVLPRAMDGKKEKVSFSPCSWCHSMRSVINFSQLLTKCPRSVADFGCSLWTSALPKIMRSLS